MAPPNINNNQLLTSARDKIRNGRITELTNNEIAVLTNPGVMGDGLVDIQGQFQDRAICSRFGINLEAKKMERDFYTSQLTARDLTYAQRAIMDRRIVNSPVFNLGTISFEPGRAFAVGDGDHLSLTASNQVGASENLNRLFNANGNGKIVKTAILANGHHYVLAVKVGGRVRIFDSRAGEKNDIEQYAKSSSDDFTNLFAIDDDIETIYLNTQYGNNCGDNVLRFMRVVRAVAEQNANNANVDEGQLMDAIVAGVLDSAQEIGSPKFNQNHKALRLGRQQIAVAQINGVIAELQQEEKKEMQGHQQYYSERQEEEKRKKERLEEKREEGLRQEQKKKRPEGWNNKLRKESIIQPKEQFLQKFNDFLDKNQEIEARSEVLSEWIKSHSSERRFRLINHYNLSRAVPFLITLEKKNLASVMDLFQKVEDFKNFPTEENKKVIEEAIRGDVLSSVTGMCNQNKLMSWDEFIRLMKFCGAEIDDGGLLIIDREKVIKGLDYKLLRSITSLHKGGKKFDEDGMKELMMLCGAKTNQDRTLITCLDGKERQKWRWKKANEAIRGEIEGFDHEIFSSIAGMHNKKGILDIDILQELIEVCGGRIEDGKIILSDQSLKIFRSITGMQHLKGLPKIDNLKKFIGLFVKSDDGELDIHLLRSITGLYGGKGIPSELSEMKELIKYIKKLIKFFGGEIVDKKFLRGEDGKIKGLNYEYLSLFTSLNMGKGFSSLDDFKIFLVKICGGVLNEHGNIVSLDHKLFGAIPAMLHGKGTPNEDGLIKLKELIVRYGGEVGNNGELVTTRKNGNIKLSNRDLLLYIIKKRCRKGIPGEDDLKELEEQYNCDTYWQREQEEQEEEEKDEQWEKEERIKKQYKIQKNGNALKITIMRT